jgi:TonB family protein
MRVHGGILPVLCTGVALVGTAPARAQDATSAKLPEPLETVEATPTPRPKKPKPEPSLEILARTSSQQPAPVAEKTPLAEDLATPAVIAEKKTRAKRRATPTAQPEAASPSVAAPLSMSGAQAMAVSAPLPEYPYEAKHANITGSGVCVMIVDTTSGKVTSAMMAQSTGNAVLDKVTTDTFKRWHFKPGTVSQVRVPITYE